MATSVNAKKNANVNADAEETKTATQSMEMVETNEQNVGMSDYRNVIKKLIASGCKRINSVTIKNVNVTEQDNYDMVSMTLKNKIRGYVNDGDGNYSEGMTNLLFTSTYAIAGALKEDEELAWLGNRVLESPKLLELLLSGATIDILQQDVVAGEEYVNPFSTRLDAEPRVYDHDIIINYIVGFTLGKIGEKACDKLMDKLMAI